MAPTPAVSLVQVWLRDSDEIEMAFAIGKGVTACGGVEHSYHVLWARIDDEVEELARVEEVDIQRQAQGLSNEVILLWFRHMLRIDSGLVL